MGLKLRIGWLCLVSTMLLDGCGSGTPVLGGGSSAVPSAAALNGNWLIVGTLPFSGPLSSPPNSSFGVALTFSSVGNNVVGGGTNNVVCGAIAASGAGEVVNGSVASDGSFTFVSASSSGLSTPSLQLTGVAPVIGANTFSGRYSFTTSGLCAGTQTGTFTATKIADVTGTYTGTAMMTFTNGSIFIGTKAVTVTFTLQQGGLLPGTTSLDAEVLAGTVTVQGAGCFSKGTSSAVPNGVLGVETVMLFTMDDGSSMNMLAAIQNAGATKLVVSGMASSGGTCATMFAPPFELNKQ